MDSPGAGGSWARRFSAGRSRSFPTPRRASRRPSPRRAGPSRWWWRPSTTRPSGASAGSGWSPTRGCAPGRGTRATPWWRAPSGPPCSRSRAEPRPPARSPSATGPSAMRRRPCAAWTGAGSWPGRRGSGRSPWTASRSRCRCPRRRGPAARWRPCPRAKGRARPARLAWSTAWTARRAAGSSRWGRTGRRGNWLWVPPGGARCGIWPWTGRAASSWPSAATGRSGGSAPAARPRCTPAFRDRTMPGCCPWPWTPPPGTSTRETRAGSGG